MIRLGLELGSDKHPAPGRAQPNRDDGLQHPGGDALRYAGARGVADHHERQRSVSGQPRSREASAPGGPSRPPPSFRCAPHRGVPRVLAHPGRSPHPCCRRRVRSEVTRSILSWVEPGPSDAGRDGTPRVGVVPALHGRRSWDWPLSARAARSTRCCPSRRRIDPRAGLLPSPSPGPRPVWRPLRQHRG